MPTKIEWCDETWNPTTGCTKVSPGCKNCYAERMAKRLQAMGQAHYANGFRVTLHGDALETPTRWEKPRMVFVDSMGDLFHQDIPVPFIQDVFDVMRRAKWHTFQILTKRAERLADLDFILDWPRNVWMGVSVESADYARRIDLLRGTRTQTKFLSLEPLLGPMSHLVLQLDRIDWVIVGGESGPGARPMRAEWVRDIRDACAQNGVPFFFKQWGGVHKKQAGRELDGRMHDAMPPCRI